MPAEPVPSTNGSNGSPGSEDKGSSKTSSSPEDDGYYKAGEYCCIV